MDESVGYGGSGESGGSDGSGVSYESGNSDDLGEFGDSAKITLTTVNRHKWEEHVLQILPSHQDHQ